MLVAFGSEVEALRPRVLDGRGDIHEMSLNVRDGLEAVRDRVMISLLDGGMWTKMVEGSYFCKVRGEVCISPWISNRA